jgi:hypothetical protein
MNAVDVGVGLVAMLSVLAVVVVHSGMADRAFWKSSRVAPWLEAALRFASSGFAPLPDRPATAPGV